MEAAVRAFEDWEFRVLERESGIDDEDDDDDGVEEREGQSEAEVERAISCQQHVVTATQVNTMGDTDVDTSTVVEPDVQFCKFICVCVSRASCQVTSFGLPFRLPHRFVLISPAHQTHLR